MVKRLFLFPICWIIAIVVLTIHVDASPSLNVNFSYSDCGGDVLTTQDSGCTVSVSIYNAGNQNTQVVFGLESEWIKQDQSIVNDKDVTSRDGSEVNGWPKHPDTAPYAVAGHITTREPVPINRIVLSDSNLIIKPSETRVLNVSVPHPIDGGGPDARGQCSSDYGVFEGKYQSSDDHGFYIYCYQQKISLVIKDLVSEDVITNGIKTLITIKDNHNGPISISNLLVRSSSATLPEGTNEQEGNDHGSSPDQAQLKEDVTTSSSTQIPSPVDDSPTTRRGESQQQDSSPTVHELEAMVMDLQAEVSRLTDLVTRLLKENAELRHDNAVLSMMVDTNQDDGDIIDEIVDDEATDTTETPQQDTRVDDSVSAPSTPTYDLSGYKYADIAPDGRPRITSTAATHSHPPTRKVFLNEWARFYDEHRDVEWWDCAGWTLYEDPVVDVPMSSINANPNEYCDLRNSEE